MKKILNLVLAYVLIFNSVFASTITNNLNVGGDSNITGSSFISKILSIAGSFVTPDSKVDGSFENGTSQWTISSGSSLTATATDFSDGAKSGYFSLAPSGTIDLCADMTTLSGRDIETSIDLKNTQTGLQLCANKNSVESGCTSVVPDVYWKNWQVISKANSTGQHCLRLKNPTTGTITGFVDSGKIGKYTYSIFSTTDSESVTFQGVTSKNASNRILFTTKDLLRSNENNLIQVLNTDRTRYVIMRDSLVNVGGALETGATTTSYYIAHHDSSGALIKYYLIQLSTSVLQNSPLSASGIKAKAGDYFEMGTVATLSSGSNYNHFSISATADRNNVVKTYEPSDRIGETIYLPQNMAPKGFISAMGSSIGKTSGTYQGDTYFNLYKVLWTVALNTAGQPYYISSAKGTDALTDWNAGKTITIDESGLFTRAFRTGVTNGVGQVQDDAFQGHLHNALFSGYRFTNGGGTDSSLTSSLNTTSQNTTSYNAAGLPSGDGTNGTPRTAAETRPKNVAKYVFIRYATSEPVVLALPTAKQQDYYIEAGGNAGQTIAKDTQDIPWALITQKNAIWDGTGFIAPEDGLYNVEGWIYNSASGPTGVTPYVNGIAKNRMGLVDGNGKLSGTIPLLKDQRLSFRYDNGTSWTVVNSLWLHWIRINRINGKNDSVAVGEVAKNQVATIEYWANGTPTTLTTSPVAMPITRVGGDSSIVSTTSTQFTLQAGEYEIEGEALCYAANASAYIFNYLYDISGAEIARGFFTGSSGNIAMFVYPRMPKFKVTLSSSKTFEWRFLINASSGYTLGHSTASPNDRAATLTITKLNGN